MGIFDKMFKKHGHKNNEEIHELLEAIKRLEEEIAILHKDLQDCLHSKKANPVRLVATFINN